MAVVSVRATATTVALIIAMTKMRKPQGPVPLTQQQAAHALRRTRFTVAAVVYIESTGSALSSCTRATWSSPARVRVVHPRMAPVWTSYAASWRAHVWPPDLHREGRAAPGLAQPPPSPRRCSEEPGLGEGDDNASNGDSDSFFVRNSEEIARPAMATVQLNQPRVDRVRASMHATIPVQQLVMVPECVLAHLSGPKST
ncbi:hypothetical protein BC826DRAFT_1179144 [Russula brevipes]|nr:hypothetical protein BC826DRAFT_1179144 [Russula brevipes]